MGSSRRLCCSLLVAMWAIAACSEEPMHAHTDTDGGADDAAEDAGQDAAAGAQDADSADTGSADTGSLDIAGADTGSLDAVTEDIEAADAADTAVGTDVTDAASDTGSDTDNRRRGRGCRAALHGGQLQGQQPVYAGRLQGGRLRPPAVGGDL